MNVPVQLICPGALEPACHREFSALIEAHAIRRLWAKDSTLWPAEKHLAQSLKANLNWLDLPDQIASYMDRVSQAAATAEADGFEDWVFAGMGGANLAAETIARVAPLKRGKRFFILDNPDPAAIRSVGETLNLLRTIIILAHKSGKTIETHAPFLYFLDKLKAAGVGSSGGHFAAFTDEDSYLALLAKQYQFRGIFLDPPGITGLYCSLIHFSVLLSGLFGFDSSELAARAKAMRDACGPCAANESNPALNLAAFLAAGALEGRDRLVILGPNGLAPLTHRIAHLIGASTGKEGHGIIPVCGDLPLTLDVFQRGCLVAVLKMQGESSAHLDEALQHLQSANVPTVSIDLSGPLDLGAELFKWEVAMALTCALLEVVPFDEPDVRQSRERTSQILEWVDSKHQLPESTVRVHEAGIQLYAERATRQQISTLSLSEALRTFFELRTPHDYLAILAFVERSPAVESSLRRIREQLASRLGIPILLAFGPRYLRYLGQLFKGGPAKGLFVIVTSEPAEDLAIPGAHYSFGQLQRALAIGDFESMVRRERLVLRLHLSAGAETGLVQLEHVLAPSLRHVRPLAH